MRAGMSVANEAVATEPRPDNTDTTRLAVPLGGDTLLYTTLILTPVDDKPARRSAAIENVCCCALLLVHAAVAYSAKLICRELGSDSTRNDTTDDG